MPKAPRRVFCLFFCLFCWPYLALTPSLSARHYTILRIEFWYIFVSCESTYIYSTLVAAKQKRPIHKPPRILNLKMRYIFKLNFVFVCSKQQNGMPNIPFAYPYRWGLLLLIQTIGRYAVVYLPWVARVPIVCRSRYYCHTEIESHMCRLGIDVRRQNGKFN